MEQIILYSNCIIWICLSKRSFLLSKLFLDETIYFLSSTIILREGYFLRKNVEEIFRPTQFFFHIV